MRRRPRTALAAPRPIAVAGYALVAVVAAGYLLMRPGMAPAGGSCGVCPTGKCCDVDVCVDTLSPNTCRAADGTCAKGGTAGCPCCNFSDECVTACPTGQC